jgi:hypothetical protein
MGKKLVNNYLEGVFRYHEVGNGDCQECSINSTGFDKPIVHNECGGLIHFRLECYEYNDYYSVCDKCGKEWDDWDEVIKENK